MTIIVTGASGGIGRSVVDALANELAGTGAPGSTPNPVTPIRPQSLPSTFPAATGRTTGRRPGRPLYGAGKAI